MTPSWPQLVGWMQTAEVRTARGRWRTVEDGVERTGTFVHRAPDAWAVRDDGGSLAGDAVQDVWSRVGWARGDDYHRAAGPVVAVEHAGRPCWQVQVEPPARKHGLLTLVVDDETGLCLRLANDAHAMAKEVVALELDVDLPDVLFGVEEDDEEDQVGALYDLVAERPPPTPRWFRWRRSWAELPDCRSVESPTGEASVGRAPLGSPPPVTEWVRPEDVVRLDHAGWSWTVAAEPPVTEQEARQVVRQVVEQPG